MDLVCFTLIIDDIVLHDGRTCMGQLGGGGSQSLFGFQLVSKHLQRPATTNVGLAAGVGDDLPQQCKSWLHDIGCDTSGLFVGQLPTPRAWQLFEADGRRTQVWRVPECDELYRQLRPSFSQLPPPFQASRHYHLGIHASHPPMKLLTAMRDAAHKRGGLLSVEPYTCCDSPPPAEQLTALLQLCDIFSPNESEAASIVGPGSPQQLVQRLLHAGAGTVLLRQGPQGVLLGHQASGVMWQVPAVPGTQVVDVTGCGNACCGGFLAAQHAGLGLIDSARWGCVAGSSMAEWQGVPPADLHGSGLLAEAGRKFQLLQGLEVLCSEIGTAQGDSGSRDGSVSNSTEPAVPASSSSTAVRSVWPFAAGGWQACSKSPHALLGSRLSAKRAVASRRRAPASVRHRIGSMLQRHSSTLLPARSRGA